MAIVSCVAGSKPTLGPLCDCVIANRKDNKVAAVKSTVSKQARLPWNPTPASGDGVTGRDQNKVVAQMNKACGENVRSHSGNDTNDWAGPPAVRLGWPVTAWTCFITQQPLAGLLSSPAE